MEKHLDGAKVTLYVKLIKHYRLSLQMKAFDPKIFKFHAVEKSAIPAFLKSGTFYPLHNTWFFWIKAFIWIGKQ